MHVVIRIKIIIIILIIMKQLSNAGLQNVRILHNQPAVNPNLDKILKKKHRPYKGSLS